MRGILASIVIIIIFTAVAIILWLKERNPTDKIIGELDTYYNGLKERRGSVRFKKHAEVICKVIESADSRWSVFSKDISGEGICLYLPEILPQDAVVDLEIRIENNRPINVRGKVVWVKELESTEGSTRRQFNAGIRFVKISPKDKEDLFNFIKKGEQVI
ncbi:MAG: PilZ domain-containing protein [Candidatus Omnitrophica bacterium]|nr:PilZ domain-containing protein [Candidatus Omnitrophota bacterium]